MTLSEYCNLKFEQKKDLIYSDRVRHVMNRRMSDDVHVFLYVLPYINDEQTPNGDIFIEVFFSVPKEIELMITHFCGNYKKFDPYMQYININNLQINSKS